MSPTFPPAPDHSITPEMLKECAEQHPLFRRLTGQVVWLLFEEQGAAPENIDAFMEALLSMRKQQLEVMATLMQNPELLLRITVAEQGPPCTQCAIYDGGLLPASHPNLLLWLPPFSLGCRCRMEAVPPDALPTHAVQLAQLPLPEHMLCCPSEWLFHHRWCSSPTIL